MAGDAKLGDAFQIQGHRGACANFQENTLPSFSHVITTEAQSVEFDVHMTKDGVLVLHHDFILDPQYAFALDGKPIPAKVAIRDLTHAEIKAIRVKDTRRIKTPHPLSEEETKIPTLKELFELFKNSNDPHAKEMILDIEIKSEAAHPEWTPPPKEMAKAVMDAVQKDWDFSKTIVRSFDHRVLAEARKIRPSLTIAALTDTGFKDYERVVRDLKPQILSPEKNSISKEQVQAAQKLGARVIPFTVNEVTDLNRMIALGMDGVTTDDPAGLFKHLQQSNLKGISLREFKKRTGCAVIGEI